MGFGGKSLYLDVRESASQDGIRVKHMGGQYGIRDVKMGFREIQHGTLGPHC